MNASKILSIITIRAERFMTVALILCAAARAGAQDRLEINYDEAKIPAFELPETLKTSDGAKVATKGVWIQRRRPELAKLFVDEVYGATPGPLTGMRFLVRSRSDDALQGRARRRQVTILFNGREDGPSLDLLIYLPKGKSGPRPCFLGLNFRGNQAVHSDPAIALCRSWILNDKGIGITEHRATESSRGGKRSRWPVETILERGYGLATACCGDIDPDFDDGFKNGVHPLFHAGRLRDEHDGGTIAAWAWGLSRCLDYLVQDPEIDGSRVAVLGHSRLGKTALWAGARDERFGIVISNDSGCGGAALSRRRFGETVGRINRSFPHWFCRRFHAYSGREDTLPVDQHQLVALVAPRPVLVSSAAADRWADPKGEFLSALHAGEVYELFGRKGLEVAWPVRPGRYLGGRVGYHLRSGRHDQKLEDWKAFLEFADRHWSGKKTPR